MRQEKKTKKKPFPAPGLFHLSTLLDQAKLTNEINLGQGTVFFLFFFPVSLDFRHHCLIQDYNFLLTKICKKKLRGKAIQRGCSLVHPYC